MRASNVEYHAPARFDDLLEMFVRISRIGRPAVVRARGVPLAPTTLLMVTAEQTLVLIDILTRLPIPVPEGFRERVRPFEGEDLVE